MDAKFYNREGAYLGKMPGVPDGTKELRLCKAIRVYLGPATSADLPDGTRMVLRAGSTDLFDPAPVQLEA